jgi:hypothetical protein
MLLNESDLVLVAHRRLFEKDETRFFVGRVDAYEAGIIKATGYSFIKDVMGGRVVRKEEARTKLVSLLSGTVLVYQLPAEAQLENIEFIWEDNNQLQVTDGKLFSIDLAEGPHEMPE